MLDAKARKIRQASAPVSGRRWGMLRRVLSRLPGDVVHLQVGGQVVQPQHDAVALQRVLVEHHQAGSEHVGRTDHLRAGATKVRTWWRRG